MNDEIDILGRIRPSVNVVRNFDGRRTQGGFIRPQVAPGGGFIQPGSGQGPQVAPAGGVVALLDAIQSVQQNLADMQKWGWFVGNYNAQHQNPDQQYAQVAALISTSAMQAKEVLNQAVQRFHNGQQQGQQQQGHATGTPLGPSPQRKRGLFSWLFSE